MSIVALVGNKLMKAVEDKQLSQEVFDHIVRSDQNERLHQFWIDFVVIKGFLTEDEAQLYTLHRTEL